MSNHLPFLLPVLGGAVAACFFFGGLWLTLQRSFPKGASPHFFVKSFLVRLAAASTFLLLLCRHSGQAWFYAMGGFLVTRMILLKIIAGYNVKFSKLKPISEKRIYGNQS